MTVVAEFSRPVAVDRIGPKGLDTEVTASEAECAALARRLQVPAVLALTCRFRLTPAEAGRVEAEGALRARLVRECVVSLEPFETEVAERFEAVFVPEGAESATFDLAAPDEIPYAHGTIDLGEAAAEQLALTLDPYPHKPGVSLPEAEASPTPFAVLRRRDG
jgi:uncharacterized metal-binding protein YceD (DUF177 family)